MIHFLSHNEIDKVKWDKCIDACLNSLPYAYSWYLDIVTNKKWCAYVWKDYEAVFPLPVSKKLLITRVLQPFFTQQLGLFYQNMKHEKLIGDFINKTLIDYRKIYLHLNTKNKNLNSEFVKEDRITHYINLNNSYTEIYNNYRNTIKKQLKAANNIILTIKEELTVSDLVAFTKQQLDDKVSELKQKHYRILEALLIKLIKLNKGFVRCVIDGDQNLLATTFFIKCNGFIIYLIAAVSESGKKNKAMPLLINSVIKEFAGQQLIFDFEGSVIPGIANFYKNFGAEEIKFASIKKGFAQ